MVNKAIVYETVREQINKMLAEGEKISVRNVRSRVGGTNSVIAEYVRKWHEEQKTNVDENNFSDELKRAIILDRSEAIAQATLGHQGQIDAYKTMLEELRMELKNQEEFSNEKIAEAEETKLRANAEMIKMSMQIENLKKSFDDCKLQRDALQSKLETITSEKYAAEKDAAVWKSKYDELLRQQTKTK